MLLRLHSVTALKQATKQPLNPDPAQEQAAVFDKAAQLFQRKDFARAKELFLAASGGPAAELSHAAQMHIRMCERRMGDGAAAVRSPDELYTLGISMLNRGDYAGAKASLEKALGQKPDADYLHYALALCTGQGGDPAAAASHLKRAIELQPANRIAALNDAEFHALCQHAAIREVLNGERNSAG